jgi:hypothetical protein
MNKKFITIILVLSILFAFPVFADTESSIVKETINVDGVDVIVYTEYIEGEKSSISIEVKELPGKKIDKLAILEKTEELISVENNEKNLVEPLALTPYKGPLHYSITGYCPQNSNILTTNIGDFYATIITPFYLKIDSTGYYKGIYSGTGTADKITTRELYKKTNASVSWSYPPSVSMTTDTGSTIEDYVLNTNTFLRYRTPVEASSFIATLKLQVTSDINVIKSGIGYPATVSIEKNIANFL